MRQKRNRIRCDRNNRWFERYYNGGYFCLPRDLLVNVAGLVDNAAFYVYVALASCHFEDNSCYAGASHIAKLTNKDERAVRRSLNELVTLGLIAREPLGKGYKIIFLCPTRQEVYEGAERLSERKGKSKKIVGEKIAQRRTPATAFSRIWGTNSDDDCAFMEDENGVLTRVQSQHEGC